ncbi:hypothetical protein PT974_01325 [Cladobotryum mycophilum]|uniref:Uncharacterized protein n=1 Tax=Cladobotryum mycophilum TaxID=491253 RepID=A0ABR0T4T2_9HYPO
MFSNEEKMTVKLLRLQRGLSRLLQYLLLAPYGMFAISAIVCNIVLAFGYMDVSPAVYLPEGALLVVTIVLAGNALAYHGIGAQGSMSFMDSVSGEEGLDSDDLLTYDAFSDDNQSKQWCFKSPIYRLDGGFSKQKVAGLEKSDAAITLTETTKGVHKLRLPDRELETGKSGRDDHFYSDSKTSDEKPLPLTPPPEPSPTALSSRQSPAVVPDTNASGESNQQSQENPMSAASMRFERSIQSIRSNESEASTQTIRSNPRPPEDSTPYPHSGFPLSGYPANSFQSEKLIFGGQVTITHPAENAFTPTTPLHFANPIALVLAGT